jgi:hypothetical protein
LILISKLKKCFSRETYLSINNFGLRRALCQIRISVHELKIERDRYKKPYVERSKRIICEKCSSNQTEDELHFIINCPLYIDNREIMFSNIGELVQNLKIYPMRQNVYGFLQTKIYQYLNFWENILLIV